MYQFANLFLGFLFWVSVCSAIKELKTSKCVEKFKSQSGTNGIFYYKQNIKDSKPITSRTISLMKELERAMELRNQHFVKFASVNCLNPDVKAAKHKECSSKPRIFYLYGEHDIEQEYSTGELFSKEAFEAKVMLFAYSDYVHIVQNADDLEYELKEARGKKDVLFLYELGLGTDDHYKFMIYAIENLKRFHYVISTDEAFVQKLFGLEALNNTAMWYMHCKALLVSSKDECKYTRYLGKEIPKQYAFETFTSNIDKPIIGQTKEDIGIKFKSNTHVLYAIVDNAEDETNMKKIMETAFLETTSLDYLLRGAIVNIKSSQDYTTIYGITNEEGVPTFALELAGTDEREIEHFPPDNEVNARNLIDFLKESISNTEQYAVKISDIYFVEIIKLSEYEAVVRDVPTLTAGCSKDQEYKEFCDFFNKNYRRLVRTLYLYQKLDFEFFYIDFTGKPKVADKMDIPIMMYRAPGKEEQRLDLDVRDEHEISYDAILKWMNKILGTDMKPLPLSSADKVSLPPQRLADELNEQHLDENLNHLQDDEITTDATKPDTNRFFYKDSVQKLTDKTFTKTLSETNFLVVLFYISFNDEAFLLQPTFAKINDALVKKSSPVQMVKVDCYQEYTTCFTQKMNSYPTIIVYSNGEKLVEYNGLLDEGSILRAIELYQKPVLIKLTPKTLPFYEKAQNEMAFTSNVDVAFYGWFAEEAKEFETYEKLAMENYGRYSFGYLIDNSKQLPAGQTLPFIGAYIRNDKFRKSVTYTEKNFDPESLKRFIARAAIPLIDELDLLNFPSYKSLNVPFILLFADGKKLQNSMEYKSLEMLAHKNPEQSVVYGWMNMEKRVTKTIRRNYIGVNNKRMNEIVMVNHTKGAVYLYDEEKPTTIDEYVDSIQRWIVKCGQQQVKPISFLNRQKFKPLREGFDFLYYQDNNIGGPYGKTLGGDDNNEDADDGDMRTHASDNLHGVNMKHTHNGERPITSPSQEEENLAKQQENDNVEGMNEQQYKNTLHVEL